jgi:hypothetical protein
VSEVSTVNPERKVTVASRVPPDLAAAVARLADEGNRTVSREVCGALAEHVKNAGWGSVSASPGPGVDLFTLSRRMGTSLAMIDATYGHLAPDADDRERALLDAFDESFGPGVGQATAENGYADERT